MKKIGIIVPHYNSVNSAIKLIESIYRDPTASEYVETIIIDDNSTQDISFLKKYIKSMEGFVRLLINDTGVKGAGACRNIGLRNLNSEWVLFADADDYFEQNYLIAIKEYWNNQTTDIVYFKCTSVETETGNISNRHVILNGLIDAYKGDSTEKNEIKLKFFWVCPWGKMIRREIIKRNDIYFDEVMVANDVMFSVRLGVEVGKIEVSNHVIYCSTKSVGSLTTTINPNNYRIRSQIMITKFNFLLEHYTKKQVKYLEMCSSQWLLEGFLVYNISIRDLYGYYKIFKMERIPFFPPLTKFNPIKILKFLSSMKVEKTFRKLDN